MSRLPIIVVVLLSQGGCDHTHDRKMLGELFNRSTYDSLSVGDGPNPFEIDGKTMPAFMCPAVQHVCAALGKDKIDFFMIWPDSTIL
jgi:hypothetical protein